MILKTTMTVFSATYHLLIHQFLFSVILAVLNLIVQSGIVHDFIAILVTNRILECLQKVTQRVKIKNVASGVFLAG